MEKIEHYGVVYTPPRLAGFVAALLADEIAAADLGGRIDILDPASGEGVLLKTQYDLLSKRLDADIHCCGIDVDSSAIALSQERFDRDRFTFICRNAILPASGMTAQAYWRKRLKSVCCVIANPPWSAEKVFDRKALSEAGYRFDVGQYDSFVLFIELCLKIVKQDGLLAFIVPDSLFSGENRALREYLLKNTEVRALCRLGEKLFPNVNRAASVLVVKKRRPGPDAKTKCYRLDTADRKLFLEGKLELYENFSQKMHLVSQRRFLDNPNCVFDIDVQAGEEDLLRKIERDVIAWDAVFRFGRGVEISKSGMVVTCEKCGMTQPYTRAQAAGGTKKCRFCGGSIDMARAKTFPIIFEQDGPGRRAMYVGENVYRYRFDGMRYIMTGVKGVRYKSEELYAPPKILIRKTGLGIYACLDYSGTYTSQTVYSIQYRAGNGTVPLEYYLGVLNSRVMYYYYLKRYGESEWKSHPYLTKDILFSLPVKAVKEADAALAAQIADRAKQLQKGYVRQLDMEIERLVMALYGITDPEAKRIAATMNALPDLSAVNQMKLKDGELGV